VSARSDHRDALRSLDPSDVPAFLTTHSGLPGPRGNLELLAAFGDVASDGLILSLVGSDDEYHASCAAAALGRLVAEHAEDDSLLPLLKAQAADPRWRVREGAAMGLQRLGDADAPRLRTVVAAWAADPDPLVQRAAVAGICEPRLLRDPATAAAALDACRVTTGLLGARPSTARRDPDVRTLRQALGYCWSVAVAGDPVAGLPAFAALDETTDPDVRWIARENRKKARLARLLDP
jgi:HEAT repeat protein